MIQIYSIIWNSDKFLQFMIDHYRNNFPNCSITFFDYQSSDNSVKIAENNNCQVIQYQYDGKLNDLELISLKNNCWKVAKSEWVLVIDPDELLQINQDQLLQEHNLGTTIIKPQGYDMINLNNDYDLNNINYGCRNTMYDKCCLFNKNKIQDINWVAGAHVCHPKGDMVFNINNYNLYHYRYLNPQFTIDRYKATAARLSEINLKTGMGDYVLAKEEEIREMYNVKRQEAKKLK